MRLADFLYVVDKVPSPSHTATINASRPCVPHLSSNRNAEQLRERAWRSTPKKKLWRCLISHRASANSLRTIQAIPTRRSKRVWVGRLQRSIDLPTGGGCSCLHLNGARKPSIARRTASRKVCGLFTLLCGPSSDRRCLDVRLSVPTLGGRAADVDRLVVGYSGWATLPRRTP